jgi:uncharacterized membrane protein SpoIIM required for sporulation
LKVTNAVKGAVQRNSLIIKSTTLAFMILLVGVTILTVLVFSANPELTASLSSLTQTVLGVGDVPSPYSADLVSFIFFNNIGHFWNPIRMIVWIPFLGPLLLGLEVLLNSGIIGVVAVISGINNGITYPIVGLVPHGILELPAFFLQFSAIVLWQVTVSETIINKLRGKPVEATKFRQGLQDFVVLAVVSIVLMGVAAVIESFVTPYLLGL